MSFLSNINFAATILTCGSVSFAASNFGIKLGRLTSFKNTSGYKYINSSKNSDKLYEDVANLAKKNDKSPKWARNKDELKNWCSKYQETARTWKDASEYCLIKNNVRHQLINQGYVLNENGPTDSSQTDFKCNDIFDSHTDENLNSLAYLYAKTKCATLPTNSETTASSAS